MIDESSKIMNLENIRITMNTVQYGLLFRLYRKDFCIEYCIVITSKVFADFGGDNARISWKSPYLVFLC